MEKTPRSGPSDALILLFMLVACGVAFALLPRAGKGPTDCSLTPPAWAQASSCGNAIVEPPEQCDPPGSITCPPGSPAMAFLPCNVNCTCPSVPTTTIVGVTTTTTLPLHFLCYEVHQPKQNQIVTLTDQFGTSDAEVRQAKRLCTPSDKNNQTQNGRTAADHLNAYKLRAPKASVSQVTVTDQFGARTMRVAKPEVLLVPAAKSLSGPPAPLTAPLDHYKCYRVKGAQFKQSGITVDDQFGTHSVNIKKPYRLCNPVSKNGGQIQNPNNHLMCYKIRNGGAPTVGTVFTTDQFTQATYDLHGTREFCVPALKTIVATTSTTIAVTTSTLATTSTTTQVSTTTSSTVSASPSFAFDSEMYFGSGLF
jgi:hypothetical protein